MFITNKTLEIELLDDCNLNCILCHRINFKRRKDKRLNLENILEKIKKYDYKTVQFMGLKSEPTQHPNFISIVKALLEFNVNIEIYTNGGQTESFWKELNDIIQPKDNILIKWCISGITEEQHKIYRKNSFTGILNNVSIMNNSINIGLFILFDYNTKDYSNPIKDNEILDLHSKGNFENIFDGMLYIHSGDIFTKGILKTQNIKNFIIDTKTVTNCIGKHINFLDNENNLYFCKYQYEYKMEEALKDKKLVTKPFPEIYEEKCNGCKIQFIRNIQDRFVYKNKIIKRKQFNDGLVYNIPEFKKDKYGT